jgi:hypothetical protein
MADKSPSEQIDDIVAHATDWRGQRLAQLREIIRQADPEISEAVKWKKPSRPEGVAVWVSNGNLCMADILKNAVRLTFPNGAQLADPSGLFNTRLDSKTVRAIDFTEGAAVDAAALVSVVREAIAVYSAKAR